MLQFLSPFWITLAWIMQIYVLELLQFCPDI